MPKSSIILIAILAGCSIGDKTELEREDEAPIQTDKLRYTAEYERGEGAHRQFGFRLIAHFTNPTGDTVFLAREYPNQTRPTYHVVVVDENPAEGSAYSPVISGVGHDNQISVPPGDTRIDTLRLVGPNMWDGQTGKAYGSLEGLMRLVYKPQSCQGDGACPLSDSMAISNAFEVQLD